MTPPVETRLSLTGYAGANAGVVRNASNENYANAGAILGGEVSWRGAFARAQVGVGTATSTNLQLGYEFDIGKNMGLELSANAQRSQSLVSNGRTYANSVNNTINMAINTPNQFYEYQISSTDDLSLKYPKGETRIGAQAKLNFGSSKAKFGVGIEAGAHTSNRPNLTTGNGNELRIIGSDGVEFSSTGRAITIGNDAKGYVTPTVSADIKLGKHLSFNANADIYQGNAGIRYNF